MRGSISVEVDPTRAGCVVTGCWRSGVRHCRREVDDDEVIVRADALDPVEMADFEQPVSSRTSRLPHRPSRSPVRLGRRTPAPGPGGVAHGPATRGRCSTTAPTASLTCRVTSPGCDGSEWLEPPTRTSRRSSWCRDAGRATASSPTSDRPFIFQGDHHRLTDADLPHRQHIDR